MKFRLDTQHYINDRLLEPGHIIGDETDVPMVLANGDPIVPSVNMTPLDDEAWKCFQDAFPGTKRPERDPTKAIPLRGTGDSAKAPALFQKNKDTGMVLQPGDFQHGQVIGEKEPEHIEVGKKGSPEPGTPNHPIGQPVTGIVGTSPVTPAKPSAPDLANHPSQSEPTPEQKAKIEADAKAKAAEEAKAKANSLSSHTDRK